MARDLAGLVLGLGNGGNSLQKLRITYRKHGRRRERIDALFNPNEIHRSRSVQWERQRNFQYGKRWVWEDTKQQFVSVDAESLSVSLFFDTYESRTSPASALQRASSFAQTASPFAQSQATDVTALTDEIVQLATVDTELHRPPICRLSWGAYGHIFTGVLTQLDQQFTMFLPDGTPVRATLACTFAEYRTKAHAKATELHSADVVKSRVVSRGDSLHSIAAQEYGDPGLWRNIARANGIVNPRTLLPGTVLTIPTLAE
jgi:hypothetical protein